MKGTLYQVLHSSESGSEEQWLTVTDTSEGRQPEEKAVDLAEPLLTQPPQPQSCDETGEDGASGSSGTEKTSTHQTQPHMVVKIHEPK